jgi:hypothetical protein
MKWGFDMARTKRPTAAQKKAAGEATGKSKYAAKKGHPSKTSPFNLEYQRNSQAARVRKSIFERQTDAGLAEQEMLTREPELPQQDEQETYMEMEN